MATIFTRIIRGEIPSYKVAEDAHYLAFLDVFPIQEGHVLVIPKKETDYIFDMDESDYAGLWNFARHVSRAIGRVIPCERVGVAVVGLEVPHAHIHLIPINTVADMDFSRPKLKFSKAEFEAIAARIAAAV